MWTKAEEVPKQSADNILERWDQTAPDVQRLIVLQKFLDCDRIGADLLAARAVIAKQREALNSLWRQMHEHDEHYAHFPTHGCGWTWNFELFDAARPGEGQEVKKCYCGVAFDPCSSDWRFNGQLWEHHHGYPVGHVDVAGSENWVKFPAVADAGKE